MHLHILPEVKGLLETSAGKLIGTCTYAYGTTLVMLRSGNVRH